MQRDGQYRGVTYRVEAIPAPGDHFIGHYRLLDAGRRRHDALDPPDDDASASAAATVEGSVDSVHPTLDTAWATENEALNSATEAACHAIETMQLGRPQAQGRGSASSQRRTDTLGQ